MCSETVSIQFMGHEKEIPGNSGDSEKKGTQEKWGLCLNKAVKNKNHCHFATSLVESKGIKSRLPLPAPKFTRPLDTRREINPN